MMFEPSNSNTVIWLGLFIILGTVTTPTMSFLSPLGGINKKHNNNPDISTLSNCHKWKYLLNSRKFKLLLKFYDPLA